ncbi:carbonic anhydrase [Leucosporidium creatinivorum]|uniref:Carbonic anhydrase n=1 Tax=Leucosporidium creatinivorum TaxID=106004 RepID=A0A1Y2G0Y3_9BASI|nr:carbonic anhydrase [Leucosporidium creatinivorum]
MSYAAESLPAANKAYQANFGSKASCEPFSRLKCIELTQDQQGSLPLPPGKKVAIVGCMDARLDTSAATGLHEGDSHHIRNAGGRAAEALRSLVISQELLGTREIIVIHHTDCGMLTFKSERLHDLIKKRVDPAHYPAIEQLAALEFGDLDKSITDDVAFLKAHPLILKETVVSGYKYHVETGELEKVV